MNKKAVKIIVATVGILLIAGILAFLLYGDNFEVFKAFFREGITRDEIRANARNFGWRGIITIGLLSMLQVVLMFLPAEPVQVIAGVSYGLWWGTLICAVGVLAGNTLIYVFYKIFGSKMSEYYSQKIDIDFGSAKATRSLSVIVLILYILPAIPYGMICFFAASAGLKYPRYIMLTLLGSLPSIFIGVALGHLAITASLIWAAVVFVLLVIVIIIVAIKREKLIAKLNELIHKHNTPYTSDTVVRPVNKFLFALFCFAFDVCLFFTRKVKIKNNVGKLNKPSIVLVTHGSFVDFMYALKALGKYYPHIVMARLYMYHKTMGRILKKGGVIPKSMFTADLESAKNCLKVIKSGEMLLMMPEARLSTVGRYEGIQNVTAKFIHKAGVDVYLLRLGGNYFAHPKWGKANRGALVEGELNMLYSAEQLKNIDFESFRAELDSAMYYDEYEWLAAHPSLRYKSKKLAEGLENVLYKCPVCGSECTGETKGRKWHCSACGFETELSDRYEFASGPYRDIRAWYDYQAAEVAKEIAWGGRILHLLVKLNSSTHRLAARADV